MRHSSFSSKVLHNRPHYNSDCSPVPGDLGMLKYFHFSANSVSHILEHPRCELGQSRSERYSSHVRLSSATRYSSITPIPYISTRFSFFATQSPRKVIVSMYYKERQSLLIVRFFRQIRSRILQQISYSLPELIGTIHLLRFALQFFAIATIDTPYKLHNEQSHHLISAVLFP